MRVYFDNAATTPLLPEVVDAMCLSLKNTYGNPSSTHTFGRQAKGELEQARRSIASFLKCSSSEILFTSGGTEADNMAFITAVEQLGVKHLITSKIEHHAVGHTAEKYAKHYGVKLSYVNLDAKGNVDHKHLEDLLGEDMNPTFVSLMHANNEIGTLLDLKYVSSLCKKYNAYFHSDTVQTMGHYAFDLSALDIDFVTCAAHKLHGPKGSGFLYVNKRIKPTNLIHGGGQERGFRAGTENISGIVGLAKAFQIANEHVVTHQQHVQGLKSYFIEQLQQEIQDIRFNGETNPEKSLYTVLSCSFPKNEKSGMLLFTLDLKGVACSGGSACSSGANKGSHVLEGIGADPERPNVRFSFSHLNTKEEVNFVVQKLKEIYSTVPA